MQIRFLFPLIFAFALVHGVQVPTSANLKPSTKVQNPWFTGPLLTPSALTIPQGHINIEPYLFLTANTGTYDENWESHSQKTFWNNAFQPLLQFGLTKILDFTFNPYFYYNYTKGAGQWAVGDIPITVDIQLLSTKRSIEEWNTALRLSLQATLPTGKYQKLHLNKKGTDVGGQGSFQPGVALNWGNIFYLGSQRFMTFRATISYLFPNSVSVKGLNAYGGNAQTVGRVYPAQKVQIYLGAEYSLSQRVAFACDALASFSGRVRFKGRSAVSNSAPSSIQISLAPALEYNWSENLGIIFGSWFTIAGKNATCFRSGVVALNYFH